MSAVGIRDRSEDIATGDGARRKPVPGRSFASLASVGLALALVTCMVLDLHLPGRTLLAAAFVVSVPGVTLADRLPLPHQYARWSVAVALSISFNVLAAQIMLLVHGWHPLMSAVALTTIAMLVHLSGTTVPGAGARVAWPPLSSVRRPPRTLGEAVTPAAVSASVLLWLASVHRISLADMNGYGLISVINWQFVAAVILIAAAAAWELTKRRMREPWLLLIAALFVIFLFGFQPAIEGPARIPVGWLHVGFADYIKAHGEVLHGYDARFYWPGFFAGIAALTTYGGLDSALPLLRWAPLAYNLLALLPLIWLARTAASSRRVGWLAVPLFYVGNWIDQDYLSPQATVYLLYLTILSLLFWLAAMSKTSVKSPRAGKRHDPTKAPGPHGGWVSFLRYSGYGVGIVALIMSAVVAAQAAPLSQIWAKVPHRAVTYLGYFALIVLLFKAAAVGDSSGRRHVQGLLSRLAAPARKMPKTLPGLSARNYLALGLSMLVIVMATVVSHQLTPITMILAMAVFVSCGRMRFQELLPITTLLVTGWFTFAAVEFWQGNLQLVFGDVGNVGFSVKAGVEEHVVGDAQHLRMQYLRLGLSAAFLIAAGLGAVVRRKSLSARLVGALAAAPFLLVLVQSYGGEVILRVILFGLPMLSVLTAELLVKIRPKALRATGIAVAAILALGGLALIGTRGVNEPFVRVTDGEYVALQHLFAAAPPNGSKIAGLMGEASPLGYRDVGGHRLVELDGCVTGKSLIQCAQIEKPDYIFVSAAQEAYGRLVQGRPAGWTTRLAATLDASGQYRTIYRNTDATVLERAR